MHQAPWDGSDPVLHVSQKPEFIDQADGTVRAYYPGEDWHVTGADHAAAIRALIDEVDRRMQDPNYVAQHFEMARRHLDGERTPGFDVAFLDKDRYRARAIEIGDALTEGRRPATG
ncbi:hypothetical protein [Nocardia bovistercoris]|uniref:Uncharacterized protein n=1 Tax=Nocardia bovistercoris TaxID=2785916 RepID=A0A931IGX7_9NOCA|nr:hypothetical protein [Nocardia bovistercoris]MBH0780373.1 hypothetical protein [Nocardia bovistercoris]